MAPLQLLLYRARMFTDFHKNFTYLFYVNTRYIVQNFIKLKSNKQMYEFLKRVGELKRRLIDVWVWFLSVILRFDRGAVFVWTL
jgi:hypothetical protein